MITKRGFPRQDVYVTQSVIKSLSYVFNTNIKFIIQLYSNSNTYVIVTQNILIISLSDSLIVNNELLAIYITIYDHPVNHSLNNYVNSNIKFGGKLQKIYYNHITSMIFKIIQNIIKHTII